MTTKNPVLVSKNFSSSSLSRVALLAGAAAALPLAANADTIVYSGPQNIVGDANGSNGDQTHTVNVDGNSASAFTFTASNAGIEKTVYVTPSNSATGYLVPSPGADPTPLSEGQIIGSAGTYVTGSGSNGTLSAKGYFGDDSNWPATGTPAFLGITFRDAALGSDTYYGWIELSATTSESDAKYDILGWAYNDAGNSIEAGQIGPDQFVPNPVPEPASLALLALGAAGLVALRARRKSGRA